MHPRIEGLRISVVRLPSRQDNVAYVIEVPQAVGQAPHQAADKRYYKRANFLNQMMEDYEIRDALTRPLARSLSHVDRLNPPTILPIDFISMRSSTCR